MSTQKKLLTVIAVSVALIALHFVWHDFVVLGRRSYHWVATFLSAHPKAVGTFLALLFLALVREGIVALGRWEKAGFPNPWGKKPDHL
jgi:hypothetical protein